MVSVIFEESACSPQIFQLRLNVLRITFFIMADCMLCSMPMTYDMLASTVELVNLSWISDFPLYPEAPNAKYEIASTSISLPSSGVYAALRVDVPSFSIDVSCQAMKNTVVGAYIYCECMIGSKRYVASGVNTITYSIEPGALVTKSLPSNEFSFQITDLTNFGASNTAKIYFWSMYYSSQGYSWSTKSSGSINLQLTWFR